MPRTARGDARAKVLAAAYRLFYGRGIHAVGVDLVAAESGVTKAALYGNFGSKDQLVAAYLRERDARWQQRMDRITGEHRDPRARVLAVFDAYEEWLADGGFRGCAFLNAAAEYPDADHPVREVVRHHKESMRGYLQAQLARLEPGQADGLGVTADRLMLLLEGAVATSMVAQDGRPVREARDLAEVLLGPAPAPAPGTSPAPATTSPSTSPPREAADVASA